MALQETPARHRPNVLFWLSGLPLILGGAGIMLFGLLTAVSAVPRDAPQLSDLGLRPDARGAFEPIVDGFAVFIIGCTVLTVGRYLWRAARRRGWRDRLGRLLIIVGYLVVTVALLVFTRFILEAFGANDMDGTGRTLLQGLIICAAIAVPGVLITVPGFRLAREVPLMEADVNVGL